MKKIIFILTICTALGFTTVKNNKLIETASDSIHWMSFDEAIAAQKENPKKLFVDAYTNWCGPCQMLDRFTFQNKDVIKYINENYYAVKFNAEGDETIHFNGNTFTNPKYNPKRKRFRNSSHQLARYLRISAYPTLLFFDEQLNILVHLKGYRTPQELELHLKLFATNDYKKVKTADDWEKYQNKFTPTFQ